MKNTNSITLNQKELKESLKVFSKVITSKCQYNIESNILLNYENNILDIIGTDGVTFIKHSIKVKESSLEIASSFSVCVLLKKLTDVVKEMKKDIDFNLSVSNNERITIEHKGSCSFIIGMNSNNFPLIPEVENNNVISINDVSNFKKVITKAHKSSTKEALKPSLQSVYFDIINKNEITIVATDGRSLFQETINTINNHSEIENILIPRTTINTLIGAIKKDTSAIDIASDSEFSRFTFDSYQITTTRIDAKYPNYKKIIPTNNKNLIELNKKELSKAVKIVRTMAKSNNTLYIKSIDKCVYVMSIDNELGQSQVEIDTTHETYRDFEIAFDYRLFEKMVKAIDDETVKISFQDCPAPAIINDKHIIMTLNKNEDYTEIKLLLSESSTYSKNATQVIKTSDKTSEAIEPLAKTPNTIKHIIDPKSIIIRLSLFGVSTKVEYGNSVKKSIVFRDLQAESSYYYRHYKAA